MRQVQVVGAAIVENGRCLAAQRGPRMSHAGQWEFPGGKVELGESPAQALQRELSEELALDAKVGAHLGRGVEERADVRIVLDVFLVSADASRLVLREHAAVRWLSADELGSVRWAPADLPLLPALERALRRTVA